MPDKKNSEVVMYIAPVTDFGFNQIFEDEEITMGFLNDLVHTNDKETDIISLTFLNKNANCDNGKKAWNYKMRTARRIWTNGFIS